ncbi:MULTISPECIES: tautomerase family protein [unclassified Caballeronia]|uniref:tautomerase family protein n=1 Tax=unclassified Caballeronia TaxID=2646786 RepID=UPI002866B990|nr:MULTISPECIES: tautomerase family protein [unclassified Caballeronia]MDR5740460.1 tautomerase family protein [Caballeronia sp. LZ016]MDR5809019.1 tautomerase family protein [Caballeronia sp. LZ019]
MPLVRISLIKGKSREHIRAISNQVHEALVEAFQVPVDDRFQLIEQRDRDDFIYDANYLGVERSDDLVFIHITASDWRNLPTKKAFYKTLATRLSVSPGLRPEDVLIVLAPNRREDWSFGRGLASYVDSEA